MPQRALHGTGAGSRTLRATFAVATTFAQPMRQHLRQQRDRDVTGERGGMSAPTRQLTHGQASMVRAIVLKALPATVSGQRLAVAPGMSTPEFYLAFRRTFGVVPVEMSRAARLATAQAKLVETRLSVADIAALTGYSHESHFARVFLKTTGMTPRDWRAAGQPGSDPLAASLGRADKGMTAHAAGRQIIPDESYQV